jgi:hypothetical protein
MMGGHSVQMQFPAKEGKHKSQKGHANHQAPKAVLHGWGGIGAGA